uniref:Chitin-binding type-2 domain-containing protein n=1 Tax=Musca domestica TaxID=7370 RepID=A0A1I8NJ13_MUSDO
MSSQDKHYGEYSGEPGCKTLDEINKAFHHFWDPTAYWECGEQGKPAKLNRCPTSKLFSGSKRECVHYTEWEWTEPKEPPSRP